MSQLRPMLFAAAISLLLSACGNKGDLVLPPPKPAPAPKTSTTPPPPDQPTQKPTGS